MRLLHQWSLLRRWNQFLHSHPLKANALQGSLLFGAGDIVAQRCIESNPDFCWRRFANATGIGLLYSGLLYPSFYGALERRLPARSLRNLSLKITADLITFGVIGNTTNIYARLRLDGEGHEAAVRYLVEHMHEVIAAECAVWPLYNVLCFTVVPLHLRPTTTSVLSLCWHTYMSRAAH
eukprot:Hpha_TRINITY_DN5707_c0_g1::TRINITY_DN5707_c0_g1_i2::g.147678::m.147678/K13348/MPV17; protein Mpv17